MKRRLSSKTWVNCLCVDRIFFGPLRYSGEAELFYQSQCHSPFKARMNDHSRQNSQGDWAYSKWYGRCGNENWSRVGVPFHLSFFMIVPTEPLRICCRQAQDVCTPGSCCALEIPTSRSPTSTHVAFLPLGQESHCFLSHVLTQGLP